jgi:tetratricopeptide (TPR) repeat protein
MFEGVLHQSPSFLPAQALLVQVYGFIAAFHALFSTDSEAKLKSFNDTWLSKADDAAHKASTLAANNPISLMAMGLSENFRGKLVPAEEHFKRAYDASPSSTDSLHLYSLFLLNVGRFRQADVMRKKLQVLEPLVRVYATFNMTSAWINGDTRRALRMPENSMISLSPAHPFLARQYALIHASQGRFGEASDAVLRAAKLYDPGMAKAASALLLAAGTGRPPDAPDLGFFNMLHVYSSTPERALDYFLTNLRAGFWAASEPPQFWHSSKEFAALRRTPRFRSMIRETGLLDFWRKNGRPDLCAGASAEDFCGA